MEENSMGSTTGLYEALKSSTRTTKWGIVQDPVAIDVLRHEGLPKLEEYLTRIGVEGLKPLSGGVSSVVLDGGHFIVRLGIGGESNRIQPNIPEILPFIEQGWIGYLRYEIMPKANTKNVSEEDLEKIVNSLKEKGIEWNDAGVDNIGIYEGKACIIDAKYVKLPKNKFSKGLRP